MLACKVARSVPQAALRASIRCSCLALLRGAFFADPIGVLFPLRFGECVFAFHLPTLIAAAAAAAASEQQEQLQL